MKLFSCLPVLSFFLLSCNSNKAEKVKADTPIRVDSGIKTPVADTLQVPDTTRIGNLYLGMKGKDIVAELGEPSSKSKAEEWGADGMVHQDWNYSGKGISLNVTEDNKRKDMELFSIMVTRPFSQLTDQKIGIGSTYTDVMKAYEKYVDKATSDPTMIVVGSIYGGMVFNFRSNKVEKIFIGAAAE